MAAVAPVLDLDWILRTTGVPTSAGHIASRWADALRAEDCRACLGTEFVIAGDAGRAVARLTEVVDGPAGERVTQYSLLFTSDTRLDEGTYRFSHAELGSTDLFIVPVVGRGGAPSGYQACVSRMERA